MTDRPPRSPNDEAAIAWDAYTDSLEAEIRSLRVALNNAKEYVESQTPNEVTSNVLAIINGVLTSPDYVP
jgi:hypothetical protein